ncbi:MAG: flagellar motor switch protein FliG [Actinobacteria bacterium]|nr:flagellar motor switch protein FliG [Actinomycetota bacterium]
MSNERKAAILLVSLSPEVSSKVMQHLSEEEIETLTLQIANLTRITKEEREHVIETFYHRCLAEGEIAGGGFNYARELLEKALGPKKAQYILEKLSTSVRVTPMSFIQDVDIKQVAALLMNEHPQTIAIVLANISAQHAAAILSSLPQELSVEVAMRLAIMDKASPDVVFSIERVLEKKLAGSLMRSIDDEVSGGIKALVEILNNVDRATEKTILEAFGNKNPELAEEVKKLMFVFEDIVTLDDVAVQKVLQDVETKELALALKGTSVEVREKITRNLSERAAEMLEEEIEYMGPVRLKQVEEAQQGIVAKIRALEEAGEIIIARGADDEVVV